MSKPSKRTREIDTYDSDDGFVSNDDNQAPRSKKTKKEKISSKGENSGASSFWAVSQFTISLQDIAFYLLTSNQLSSGRTPRRVEITEFRNMKLVNIREYYEKDDAYLPGKKVL